MDERFKEHPSERRQALIEAAFGFIAQRGFEGLRLRDVAAAAGIDHSTLHHHFATKQDLIDAVVGYAVAQFRTVSDASAPPHEQLRLHLDGLSRTMGDRPDLFVVMRELDLRATRDAAVRTIIARHEEGWRLALARRLESVAADLDRQACVELIIAAVKGVSLRPASAPSVLSQLERLIAGAGTSA